MMFYGSVFQTMILVYLIVTLVFLFARLNYRQKKVKEYKNDERWKNITMKADQVIKIYYDLIALLIGMGFVAQVFLGFHMTFDIQRVLQYAVYILFLKYPIEYFALRHYDRAM